MVYRFLDAFDRSYTGATRSFVLKPNLRRRKPRARLLSENPSTLEQAQSQSQRLHSNDDLDTRRNLLGVLGQGRIDPFDSSAKTMSRFEHGMVDQCKNFSRTFAIHF
jgi:hypothetical protein